MPESDDRIASRARRRSRSPSRATRGRSVTVNPAASGAHIHAGICSPKSGPRDLRQRAVQLADDEHPRVAEAMAPDNLDALTAPRLKRIVDRRLATLGSGSIRRVQQARANRTWQSASPGPACAAHPMRSDRTGTPGRCPWPLLQWRRSGQQARRRGTGQPSPCRSRGRTADHLCRLDPTLSAIRVILDELGYLPFAHRAPEGRAIQPCKGRGQETATGPAASCCSTASAGSTSAAR